MDCVIITYWYLYSIRRGRLISPVTRPGCPLLLQHTHLITNNVIKVTNMKEMTIPAMTPKSTPESTVPSQQQYSQNPELQHTSFSLQYSNPDRVQQVSVVCILNVYRDVITTLGYCDVFVRKITHIFGGKSECTII